MNEETKTTAPPVATTSGSVPPHAFRAVRRASVPLVGYECPDYEASMRDIVRSLNGKADTTPVIVHDIIRGLFGGNDAGKGWCDENEVDPLGTGNPTEALSKLAKSPPEGGLVFILNAHRDIEDGQGFNAGMSAALLLCRSAFESVGANLVLMAPALRLPPELQRDVIVLTEPLPGVDALGAIVDDICGSAGIPKPEGADRDKAADTLLGLAAFEARQVTALAVTKTGIDSGVLWQRKKRAIEATEGLTVWSGGETFDDLGGLANIKAFLLRVLTSGKTPVRAISWCDEIEKQLAGSGGDTSGTSQDQLSALLTFLQDKSIPAMLLVGHPGTGKSAIAKATGAVAGVPVLAMDLGAMKGKFVGESERKIREALSVLTAVSSGKAMMIMTCNKLSSLPPEFRRRCTLGTFFFDLPDGDEQAVIWRHWLSKFGFAADSELPACDRWTGAEIKACCDVAYRTSMTLVEASKFVVPISKSAPESIKALQEMAHNRFISASKPGLYQLASQAPAAGRRITTE